MFHIKEVAGVAGNIFAFGLYISPIPTFKRIVQRGSTEQFSGLPYVYSFLACLINMWYGTPPVSKDNLFVTTVNTIGAVFQSTYIILFIIFAEPKKKLRMGGLLVGVLVTTAIVIFGSLQIADFDTRNLVVGILSCISLVSVFASPLFIISLVIRTKSVEFMPFYLSLATFLLSVSFLVYGLLNLDAFVYVPNAIGTILATIQLALYAYYYSKTIPEGSTEPLIV